MQGYAARYIELSCFALCLISSEYKKTQRFEKGLRKDIRRLVGMLQICEFSILVDKAIVIETGIREDEKSKLEQQFLRANYAVFRNKQLHTLPELELSEEIVNNAAASIRAKINYMLLMARDITLGKDFRLFFKVVVCLWLLSVIGGFFSFFTLAYIGTIVSMILPAVYSKYREYIDRCCGLIHRKFSKHYRIVDESFISRLPRSLSKEKET
ncbi:reticulon-like protein B16 [Malania oleifera]|uniref:reticulon-like protein B16 n=1 Tax=Malania oleifera TaxID=397392 RepID=UPI0025AE9C9B|nr:reticulon-like protein B16 [Malania oleifera]